MDDIFSWVPVIRFIIFAVVMLLVYFLVFRRYARYLYGNYGYKIDGAPTKLAIVCCAIIPVLSLFGINSFSEIGLDWAILNPEPGDVMGMVLMMVALATPGVVISTLVCLARTRRPLIALLNVPLLYVFAALMGYFIVFYIVLLIIGLIAGGLLAGVAAGPAGGVYYETHTVYEHEDPSIYRNY